MEIYKEIPGYTNYKVSNLGNVYSLFVQRVIKQYTNAFGYLRIRLHNNDGSKTFYVHRLVAMAFLDYDKSLQVNHKNGIKTDNCAENLEMLSGVENAQHSAHELGNMPFKRITPLSASEKRAVHRLKKMGYATVRIADLLGVSPDIISKIVGVQDTTNRLEFRHLLEVSESVKPVIDFDGYYISNLGNVYSEKVGKRLIPKLDKKNGYLFARFRKDGKLYFKSIHRLVAIHFLDRPIGSQYIVHHINKNRNDNRSTNLEWITYSENNFRRFDK